MGQQTTALTPSKQSKDILVETTPWIIGHCNSSNLSRRVVGATETQGGQTQPISITSDSRLTSMLYLVAHSIQSWRQFPVFKMDESHLSSRMNQWHKEPFAIEYHLHSLTITTSFFQSISYILYTSRPVTQAIVNVIYNLISQSSHLSKFLTDIIIEIFLFRWAHYATQQLCSLRQIALRRQLGEVNKYEDKAMS